MTGLLEIVSPEGEGDMAAFRKLAWDYRDFLLGLPDPDRQVVLASYPEDKYRMVLDAAETENRPPRGQMRLLKIDGVPMGCGTIQSLGPGDAEIKRVYISPDARGTGAGRVMMLQLIEDCKAMGFRRILMDTGRLMTSAQGLYDSLGFKRRDAYQPIPDIADGILVFFEMEL